MYVDPKISQVVLNTYLQSFDREHDGLSSPLERSPFVKLTPRHREILQLVVEGKSTKEVAAILNLKVKTVEIHREQLMKRLDIHNVAGLVRYAVRYGIISDA